jgi:hypothetical protein
MVGQKDTATATLPGIKPSTVTKKRGRPRIYADAAARQQAYKSRSGIATLTVQLPAELKAEFEAWLAFKDKRKSAVIEKLIRTQLLRKR